MLGMQGTSVSQQPLDQSKSQGSSSQYVGFSFNDNIGEMNAKMDLTAPIGKEYGSFQLQDFDLYGRNKLASCDYLGNYKQTTTSSSLCGLTEKKFQNQEELLQRISLLESQKKEQEDRILNLQKLNDQLMSAITDVNGSDQLKHNREKEMISQQHEKDLLERTNQIKDLKNRLDLQRAQMNERLVEMERDKLMIERQLDSEAKKYSKQLEELKEQKEQMNFNLKESEVSRQKNQEAAKIIFENKVRLLEETIEIQKKEEQNRTDQLISSTEKTIVSIKQIHENEKNILLCKIQALQGEKKMIEQQSDYNFRMFTEAKSKSDNQQGDMFTEVDKQRKKQSSLELKAIEKDNHIALLQQKLENKEFIFKSKEKSQEEEIKKLKTQNSELSDQIPKLNNEIKRLQFVIQEKESEMNDKSKELKKQVFNEKKKVEIIQDAANRIKEDYTKKNSFVISELLSKEEKLRKLSSKIHQKGMGGSTIPTIATQNNQNNTSQSFINNNTNTNMNASNIMNNNMNMSSIMNNPIMSASKLNNRPSERSQQQIHAFGKNTVNTNEHLVSDMYSTVAGKTTNSNSNIFASQFGFQWQESIAPQSNRSMNHHHLTSQVSACLQGNGPPSTSELLSSMNGCHQSPEKYPPHANSYGNSTNGNKDNLIVQITSNGKDSLTGNNTNVNANGMNSTTKANIHDNSTFTNYHLNGNCSNYNYNSTYNTINQVGNNNNNPIGNSKITPNNMSVNVHGSLNSNNTSGNSNFLSGNTSNPNVFPFQGSTHENQSLENKQISLFNSPSNGGIGEIANEFFLSPQYQKVDLTAQIQPQTTRDMCSMNTSYKDMHQKGKRSISQVPNNKTKKLANSQSTKKLFCSISPIRNHATPKQQINQKASEDKRSLSPSPMSVPQKEITSSNTTLITFETLKKEDQTGLINNQKQSIQKDISPRSQQNLQEKQRIIGGVSEKAGQIMSKSRPKSIDQKNIFLQREERVSLLANTHLPNQKPSRTNSLQTNVSILSANQPIQLYLRKELPSQNPSEKRQKSPILIMDKQDSNVPCFEKQQQSHRLHPEEGQKIVMLTSPQNTIRDHFTSNTSADTPQVHESFSLAQVNPLQKNNSEIVLPHNNNLVLNIIDLKSQKSNAFQDGTNKQPVRSAFFQCEGATQNHPHSENIPPQQKSGLTSKTSGAHNSARVQRISEDLYYSSKLRGKGDTSHIASSSVTQLGQINRFGQAISINVSNQLDQSSVMTFAQKTQTQGGNHTRNISSLNPSSSIIFPPNQSDKNKFSNFSQIISNKAQAIQKDFDQSKGISSRNTQQREPPSSSILHNMTTKKINTLKEIIKY